MYLIICSFHSKLQIMFLQYLHVVTYRTSSFILTSLFYSILRVNHLPVYELLVFSSKHLKTFEYYNKYLCTCPSFYDTSSYVE